MLRTDQKNDLNRKAYTKISMNSYDVDEPDHDARFDDRYSGWG